MPNKTPDDAALQSTKQMLDELDALMEKMLTLPVNDPDEAPAFPPPIMKEPALSATLTLLEPSETANKKSAFKALQQKLAAEARTEDVEAPSAPLPYNPPHFEIDAVLTEPPRDETPEPKPLTNEVTPASVLPELDPLMKEIAEPSASSLGTQWLYAPLVWVNLGFDGVTLAFGGAGSWMRSDGGRMLLGLLGFALLVAAVVWFLKDWLGWNW